MPVIFRIRDRFDELWAEENKQLEVTLTSAVELDPEVVERVGAEIERQTDRKIELEPRSTRRSSAASCCKSATWWWTRACAAGSERLRKEVAVQAA